MSIVKEIKGLYKIIHLKEFRRTTDVVFSVLTPSFVPKVDAVDKVLHKNGAVSPGVNEKGERTWYMHPHQDDNLIVLQGERNVELYTKKHGEIEKFTVTPDCVYMDDGKTCFEESMLVWPRGVFHRIISGDAGSTSINLATHYEGFDVKTNFNIYNLDTDSGEYAVYRYGFEDQVK